MRSLESAVLTAWYGARPEIRRLLAIRDAEGLRVLVRLEPANDSDEIHPAWLAKHDEWMDELQWHTGRAVRLERVDEMLDNDEESGGVVVADLAWRDPSFN